MTRIRTGEVQVHGLTELHRALKSLEDVESRREVRDAGKEAARTIAGYASASAASQGSTLGHIAPSIKPSAGYTSAGVGFGGAAYPMAAGAEFGGGGRPTTRQFRPWRGSGSGAGYAVYPSIRDHANEVVEPYEKAVNEIARKAGL